MTEYLYEGQKITGDFTYINYLIIFNLVRIFNTKTKSS